MSNDQERPPAESPKIETQPPTATVPPKPEEEMTPAQVKLDPETLVLRAELPPVVRFKKPFIVGAVATAAAVLATASFHALRPVTFGPIVAGEVDLGMSRPPEELSGVPTSYGDVPKLGPPLPGDLGRPILDAQLEQDVLSKPPVIGQRAAEADALAAAQSQAAETEHQRIEAERLAARRSAIMLQIASQSAATSPDAGTSNPSQNVTAEGESRSNAIALDPARDPNNQRVKADFLKQQAGGGDVNPHRLQRAMSPWTLSAGSIISASLVTGLNSDLPGMVIAQVTENAYDSVTGRTLLLPQGARIIGSYDSVVAFGQSRALLVWQRIILPDGSSIRIDNLPASDASGYAGLADQVDRHSWSLIKGIALSTLLGVGTEMSFGSSESDLVKAIRQSTQQSADRAGQQIVEKNLSIQPTIKVRPGWPLKIVVHKDIILKPWRR